MGDATRDSVFDDAEILHDLRRALATEGAAEQAAELGDLDAAQILRDELRAIKENCPLSTYAIVLGVTALLFKRGGARLLHIAQKYDAAGNPIPKKAQVSVIDGGRAKEQP